MNAESPSHIPACSRPRLPPCSLRIQTGCGLSPGAPGQVTRRHAVPAAMAKQHKGSAGDKGQGSWHGPQAGGRVRGRGPLMGHSWAVAALAVGSLVGGRSTEAQLTSNLTRVPETSLLFRVNPKLHLNVVITHTDWKCHGSLFWRHLHSEHVRAPGGGRLTDPLASASIFHVPKVFFHKVSRLQPAYSALKHANPSSPLISKDNQIPSERRCGI